MRDTHACDYITIVLDVVRSFCFFFPLTGSSTNDDLINRYDYIGYESDCNEWEEDY